MRSTAKHLADLILGEPVEDWMQRKADKGLSLRTIAQELDTVTDGRVSITHTTVAQWLAERGSAAARAS